MKFLSYILLFLFIISIYYYNIIIYEHFDIIKNDNDIFQSLINPYNILKNKCYYKSYNNTNLLTSVNNILNKVKINNLLLSSNLILIQKQYIINYMTEIFKVLKKTNYLYHYYNKIVNLNTFFDLLSNYLSIKIYDEISWILLCYKILIDNNLFSGNHNDISLIANFILEEMKKFRNNFFLENKNLDLNIESNIYTIKNKIFYNDDGYYFINNNIFDCKINYVSL